MSRLIDADKLKKDVLDLPNCYNGFSDTYDKACIIDVIDEQPTIESERKTGKWKRRIVDSGYNADWICSECGYRVKTDFVNYKFCPNCQADMRGEEHEDIPEGTL